MTPGEKVALRALAMERQSTMSEVLRIALRGYLQSNAPGAPAMGDHTCKPSRVVPIELAELKDTIIAKLIGEKTALAARLEAARLVVNELRAKWYSEEGRASLALIASELDRNAG